MGDRDRDNFFFDRDLDKGSPMFMWLVKTKVNATMLLRKAGSISFDDAKKAYQSVDEVKLEEELQHYCGKNQDYYGDPGDQPLADIRPHHYRCLRTLKAFFNKTEKVSKIEAACSFWVLFNEWSDEIYEYAPEGCGSNIDANELPIKDLQPCMYTYFRVLGGYWCKQEDGLGFWGITTVDGELGYKRNEAKAEEGGGDWEADVNKEENDGCTPLYAAAFKGHSSVVELLLEVDGVDMNKADNDGCTPLYAAAEEGHSSVVELLLQVDGVDVNKSDKNGLTPLYIAVFKGHSSVVELLLEVDGLDVNKESNNGLTVWI